MTTLRRPIPRVGKQAGRWMKWRDLNRGIVSRRARGRCECCEAQGVGIDWHHVAGRGHLLEEPFASWHLLTCGLCRTCHNSVHNDPLGKEAVKVQTACVSRLMDHSNGKMTEPWPDPRPLDLIREYVRQLVEDGFNPQGER
ncbi:MAG: hypothetical protein ACYDD0_00810 [Candidatus Dormibacteria bacterium]